MRTESDVYIQLAWQAFSRKALTTPAQDCVVKWAKLSLALVPQNEQALAVLRGVIDTYLDWSLRVEAGNRPALAARYLNLAQSLYQYASDEQESIITTLERNMDINAAAGNTGFASTASDGSVIAIEDTHKELRDDKQVLQLMVSQLRQRLTRLGIHQRNIPYLTN